MSLGAPISLLTLFIVVLCAATSVALESNLTSPGFIEIIPEQIEAIERGVTWLARQQNREGSWHAETNAPYPAAMTGLAGLALLACGSTPGRGKFGSQISSAIVYLLKQQDSSGLIAGPQEDRTMYGHGFAMTFLAECYGMEGQEELSLRLRSCLEKAILLTGRAQSHEGGWYYSPNSGTDEGSVTITQVQALRACQNVGIEVPRKILDRAIDYMRKSQQPDGGIAYRIGMRDSRPALTAAGAELFLMAGMYDAPETKKALDYVRRNISAESTINNHDSYTTFYTAQALHHVGGDDWARYFEARRRRYIRDQKPDGFWHYGGWGASRVMDTAIAIVVLTLPYQYLPLYQR